jgi:hypothetical protein
VQLINEQGTEGIAEGFRLLVNEAMRHERGQSLKAEPYQRTDARIS